MSGEIDKEKCRQCILKIENLLFELSDKERDYVVEKLF